MMKARILVSGIMVLLCVLVAVGVCIAAEGDVLKPYVMASNSPGTIEKALPDIRQALEGEGFEIAGEYSPYKGVHILAVTSEALRKTASLSPSGGYGAVVRVALTESGENLQVSYTSPLYTALAYRMNESLSAVAGSLAKALGSQSEFGSARGIKADELKKYHYMVMMPYFTDQVKLASFGSQEEAVKAVEEGLAKAGAKAAKVYRIDVPGKKESVFGVAIKSGDGADETIMKVVDIASLKHSAHLPYELLVSEGKVYMLHGKFRIALSFPDLTMGTFMKISGAPSAIEDSLKEMIKGR